MLASPQGTLVGAVERSGHATAALAVTLEDGAP